MTSKPKRPRDPNELAKLITDIAVRDKSDDNPNEGKDPAAVALGRKGGLKGGASRAKTLSDTERSEIASKAAKVRWAKTTEKS